MNQIPNSDQLPPGLLTQREAECLALASKNMDSKRIGRTLNLSNHTVDKYIKDAMRKIGVSDRFQCGILVRSSPAYQSLVSPVLALVPADLHEQTCTVEADEKGSATRPTDGTVSIPHASGFDSSFLPVDKELLSGWGDISEWSWQKRTAMIVIFAIVSAVAIGTLLTAMLALSSRI